MAKISCRGYLPRQRSGATEDGTLKRNGMLPAFGDREFRRSAQLAVTGRSFSSHAIRIRIVTENAKDPLLMSLVIAEAVTFTFGCALIHRYRARPASVTAALTAALALFLLMLSMLSNWQIVGHLCGIDKNARFPTEFCTGLASF